MAKMVCDHQLRWGGKLEAKGKGMKWTFLRMEMESHKGNMVGFSGSFYFLFKVCVQDSK